MAHRLALHLLGPPKLESNNAPVAIDRRKALALLAFLALHREQHRREYVSALLWPDYDQEKAFTNLRHTLWETQQLIGEGWIAAGRETLGLNRAADIWVDVTHFESLIKQSQAHGDMALRLSLLTDSVHLYRDHFMTGFSLKDAPHFNEWLVARSEDLHQQFALALRLLSDGLCSSGQAEVAMPYARRLVAHDPLNEVSHRLLMEIYIQAGQHNAALKQYQSCERILRKELGVDPQPETRALYKRLRNRDNRD